MHLIKHHIFFLSSSYNNISPFGSHRRNINRPFFFFWLMKCLNLHLIKTIFLFQTIIFTTLIITRQALFICYPATGRFFFMDIVAKPSSHFIDGLTSWWLKLILPFLKQNKMSNHCNFFTNKIKKKWLLLEKTPQKYYNSLSTWIYTRDPKAIILTLLKSWRCTKYMIV